MVATHGGVERLKRGSNPNSRLCAGVREESGSDDIRIELDKEVTLQGAVASGAQQAAGCAQQAAERASRTPHKPQWQHMCMI